MAFVELGRAEGPGDPDGLREFDTGFDPPDDIGNELLSKEEEVEINSVFDLPRPPRLSRKTIISRYGSPKMGQ